MATHSSILAWRIPWTEELDGLKKAKCHNLIGGDEGWFPSSTGYSNVVSVLRFTLCFYKLWQKYCGDIDVQL